MTRSVLLALAWGLLALVPFVRRARRVAVRARLPRTRRGARPPAARRRAPSGANPVGAVFAGLWHRRRRRRDAARVFAELPLALDLLQVAVGAGATPYRAVEVTARWGPATASGALRSVLDRVRLGDSLAAALASMAHDRPPLAPLADVLIASEQLGSPAGPTLARIALDVRGELRRRADARARVLPVKLLFPLVFLVLPAFGLLTVVPALLSALSHV